MIGPDSQLDLFRGAMKAVHQTPTANIVDMTLDDMHTQQRRAAVCMFVAESPDQPCGGIATKGNYKILPAPRQ